LVGEAKNGELQYSSITSCISPLGNANDKHIVTIEGLNMEQLSPVQQAMVDNAGTQCGFCTPGFVVSLSGYCLTAKAPTTKGAISSIDGNICRCTGYKSIERAAAHIAESLKAKDTDNGVKWLANNKYIPAYFSEIQSRLEELKTSDQELVTSNSIIVGGGTDLFVQRHDDMYEAEINLVFDNEALKGINIEAGICTVGGAVTAAELMDSKELNTMFSNLYKHLKLVSSTPIRNMGTVAGNLVNASPIGDLTAFFLSLNASVNLEEGNNKRTLALKDFYFGYKTLDKKDGEQITAITFEVPSKKTKFNFEKVSKRTYLDIASVNCSISLTTAGNQITDVHIAAGGVGPIPTYLTKTRDYLIGKTVSPETVSGANEVIQSEISPIADARGDEKYKRLLLRQLFYAHFIELFPAKVEMEALV
jgi:xanthine dehydrogenase small subunit